MQVSDSGRGRFSREVPPRGILTSAYSAGAAVQQKSLSCLASCAKKAAAGVAKKGTGAHELRLWRRHLDPWEQLASLFVFSFFLADRHAEINSAKRVEE